MLPVVPMLPHSARRTASIANTATSKLKRMRNTSNAPPPVIPSTTASSLASPTSTSLASTAVNPLANTFQDRLVDSLVKRVKQTLPYFSGHDITIVEADESVRQTVETLVELSRASIQTVSRQLVEILCNLEKQWSAGKVDHKLSIQILQSELLVLKILDVCVMFHWHSYRDRVLGFGYPNGGSATSLQSNAAYAQGNHPSTIAHSPVTPWVEPPPLEENLARVAIKLLGDITRRSATEGGSELSFHDFEAIEATAILTPSESPNSSSVSLPPKPGQGPRSQEGTTNSSSEGSSAGPTRKEQDPYSVIVKPFGIRPTYKTLANQQTGLHTLLAKFAGRLAFSVSASNWPAIYSSFRAQIHSLASHGDFNDISDIRLVGVAALDQKKLVQVLQEIGNLLPSMRRDAQIALASTITNAVTNWVDTRPQEYRDASKTSRALAGAPERVFDAYYHILDETNRQKLWPALSALLSISPERIRQAERAGGGFAGLFSRSSSRKPSHFLENVSRGLLHSRTFEASIAAYHALCRAAIHIPPTSNNVAIRALAPDLAEAIRVRLMMPSAPLKPFYEATEPIDMEVISNAMVTIYRSDAALALETVFIPCLSASRSDGVKVCVVSALITLSTEASRLQWQTPLSTTFNDLAPILRNLFCEMCLRKRDVGPDGRVHFKASHPRVKSTDGSTSDRDLLMLAILSLWRLEVGYVFCNITREQMRTYVDDAGQPLVRPEATLLRASAARTFGGLFNFAQSFSEDDPCYVGGLYYLTEGLPITLAFGSNLFMKTSEVPPVQIISCAIMNNVLSNYANPTIQDSGGWKSSVTRVAGFATCEFALLVALTSASVEASTLAAMSLRCIAVSEMTESEPSILPSYLSADEMNLRWYAYKQLVDHAVVDSCRLAQQKRIRKLVQNLAFVNGLNIMVWDECFRRWLALTPLVKSAREGNNGGTDATGRTSEYIQHQWQNLCLFLASFAACCDTDLAAAEIKLPKVPPEFNGGRYQIAQAPKEMLRQFIGTVKDLLLADNMLVRDTAREALGAELHPSAYGILLPQIDKSIHSALSNQNNFDWDANRILFVDQVIGMFRSLVERTTSQWTVQIDGAGILLLFASFLQRSDNSEAAYRLRMRFCSLVEGIVSRRELFPLRQDTSVRAELLERTFEWVAGAQAAAQVVSGSSARFYMECELAGLRACVALLDHQVLGAGTSKIPSSHTASMLFHRYFSTFIASLATAEEPHVKGQTSSSINSSLKDKRGAAEAAKLKQLVVQGLVNMLSANNDVGPRHAITLGFSEDLTKRTVCAEVFSLLMRQGMKFDTTKTQESRSPRLALCEQVRTATPLLVLAICQCVPDAETESIIAMLLRILYTRTSAMGLLRRVIDMELQSKNAMGQFRNNTTQVRLMSTFAKLQSEEYLRRILKPVVEKMASVPAAQYETDPHRAGIYELDDNLTNLEYITQTFLDNLYESVELIPDVVKEICTYIYNSMSHESPDLRLVPVISFFFLRVVTPGLAQPESVGVDLPVDIPAISRGLVLIAKTIQALANSTRLNDSGSPGEARNPNIARMTQFCRTLVTHEPSYPADAEEVVSIPFDESDGLVLHRFLNVNAEKISQTLQTIPSTSLVDETEIRTTIWEEVSACLLDLGKPPEFHHAPLPAREHSAYREFLQRQSHRNMDSVKDIFVKLTSPKGGKAVFGLFISRIDVDEHDIELLIAHIFKMVTNINLHNCPFDIVVDLSGFNSSSEVPVTFWLQFLQLLPEDLIDRLNCLFVVNSNIAAQRFLRRLYYLASGLKSRATVLALTSFQDLEDYIPTLNTRNISLTAAMDTEPRETFDEVSFQQAPEPPLRATLELASSHLRIVSKRPQQIWPGLACRVTEIVTLDEIGQLLSVSASGEDEFVLRPVKGRPTFLRARHMPLVVNAIKTAAAKTKLYQPAVSTATARVETTTATLITIALVNISHRNEELRLAMLNLLHDISKFLGLRDLPLLPPKGSFVPFNPFAIASDFSKRLATSFSALTLDVLQAFCSALGSFEPDQRPTAIQLIAGPWVRNLALFTESGAEHYDLGGDRLRDTIRMLVETTVKHDEVYGLLQRYVWVEVSRMEADAINLVLDQFIVVATTSGIGTRPCEVVADTLVSLASTHTRGKLLARLRTAFTRDSVITSKTLSEENAWHQLAALARLVLVSCHHGRFPYQLQLFVPELVHAIVATACYGPLILRTSLHDMATNLVGALHLARFEDPEASRMLSSIQEELLTDKSAALFGLTRADVGDGYEAAQISPDDHVKSVNELVNIFLRVIDASAASETLANVWRARWMSLISSTAVNMWPALQTRAFLTFGCLATEVDDNFVELLLGLLRDSLSSPQSLDITQVSVTIRALSTMVPNLKSNSIHLPQLFWLCVGMMSSTNNMLYIEAANLMGIVLVELQRQSTFDYRGMANILLEAREPLLEPVTQIEDMLTISFESSFSFSMACIIWRGVRHQPLRSAAEKLLRTLLRVNAHAMKPHRSAANSPNRVLDEGSLPFLLCLLSYSTTHKGLLQVLSDADASSGWVEQVQARMAKDPSAVPILPVEMLGISDVRTAVLHSSFIIATLPNAAGDASERDLMYKILSDTAHLYPQIVALACKHALSTTSLDDSITSVFASNSSQSMASALTLLRLTLFDFAGSNKMTSPGMISQSYAPSMVDSLGDTISVQSSTEIGTLLETYSMDGLLNISTQWLGQSTSVYEKMLPIVASMINAMLS